MSTAFSVNEAYQNQLRKAFGKVSLLPGAREETSYTYADAAYRYLTKQQDHNDLVFAEHSKNWFVGVVGSWLQDIGLDNARKQLKEETFELTGKQKPLGKTNWLDKIATGQHTDLPNPSHRDEIMYLIFSGNIEKCAQVADPDKITDDRKGGLAPYSGHPLFNTSERIIPAGHEDFFDSEVPTRRDPKSDPAQLIS